MALLAKEAKLFVGCVLAAAPPGVDVNMLPLILAADGPPNPPPKLDLPNPGAALAPAAPVPLPPPPPKADVDPNSDDGLAVGVAKELVAPKAGAAVIVVLLGVVKEKVLPNKGACADGLAVAPMVVEAVGAVVEKVEVFPKLLREGAPKVGMAIEPVLPPLANSDEEESNADVEALAPANDTG